MQKKSFSPHIKVLALQYVEENRLTFQEIWTMFSVDLKTLQVWRAPSKYGLSPIEYGAQVA